MLGLARLKEGSAVATIAVPPTERQNAERKFYTRMVLSLVALVFLGFAPSFYLRGIVPPIRGRTRRFRGGSSCTEACSQSGWASSWPRRS